MNQIMSLLCLLILFPASAFSQSFEEKPYVPVFQVSGERVVRVDCWGLGRNSDMESVFLKSSEHPDIFSIIKGDTVIEVSLLKSENTLLLEKKDPVLGNFAVTTYGLSVGYSLNGDKVDCQIFTGELEDN